MEFKNIEKFESWLKSVLKADTFDLKECLKDVEMQHNSNGCEHYEVEFFSTKSGNPECYYYDVETTCDEENDIYTTTIIF